MQCWVGTVQCWVGDCAVVGRRLCSVGWETVPRWVRTVPCWGTLDITDLSARVSHAEGHWKSNQNLNHINGRRDILQV